MTGEELEAVAVDVEGWVHVCEKPVEHSETGEGVECSGVTDWFFEKTAAVRCSRKSTERSRRPSVESIILVFRLIHRLSRR